MARPELGVMYGARFNFLYALLAVIAVCAIGSGFVALASTFNDPKTITRELPAEPFTLTGSVTVADVVELFGGAPIPGSQMGLPDTCQGNPLKDGIVVVCAG